MPTSIIQLILLIRFHPTPDAQATHTINSP